MATQQGQQQAKDQQAKDAKAAAAAAAAAGAAGNAAPKDEAAAAAAKEDAAGEGETPKTRLERFQEIAPKRTRALLKGLEILGNCSNKSGYEYTQENVDKIFGALEAKLKEVKAKFSPKAGGDKTISFEL